MTFSVKTGSVLHFTLPASVTVTPTQPSRLTVYRLGYTVTVTAGSAGMAGLTFAVPAGSVTVNINVVAA